MHKAFPATTLLESGPPSSRLAAAGQALEGSAEAAAEQGGHRSACIALSCSAALQPTTQTSWQLGSLMHTRHHPEEGLVAYAVRYWSFSLEKVAERNWFKECA